MSADLVPERLREEADAVAEHLSALRGAGLLLSGTDAALLVGWLDHGVPTAVIVVALERVAERRRQRRVKTRLCLASCKGEVKRMLGRGLDPLAAAPLAAVVPAEAPAADQAALEARALAEIDALPPQDPGARADRAMAVVRAFHRAAWEAAAGEHAALRARAGLELAALRDGMEPGRWEEAVEEVARDLLRQRFPRLSAVAVWDRLQGP